MDRLPNTDEINWTSIDVRLSQLVLLRNCIILIGLVPVLLLTVIGIKLRGEFTFMEMIGSRAIFSLEAIVPEGKSVPELILADIVDILSLIGYVSIAIVSMVGSIALPCVLVYLLMIPLVEVQRRKYALGEREICYRRGLFRIKTSRVPFNRIQYIVVGRSLLDRIFRLATLEVYTATGPVSSLSIRGLPPNIAFRIQDDLLTRNAKSIKA